MLAEVLSKYKSGLSLTFTIIFSLGCLFSQSNILARGLNQAGEMLDFFTGAFHSLGTGISEFVDSVGSYQSMKEERDRLRERLKDSQDLTLRNSQLREENQRLRSLLDLPQLTDFPVIQAQVISQDPDNWFRTIIINKGSEQGIEAHMPVIAFQVVSDSLVADEALLNQKDKKMKKKKKKATDSEVETLLADIVRKGLVYGVVGKVIQVNSNSARILPITDQYSRLGVLLRKSGHWALLVGQAPYAELPELEYLSLAVFARAGDAVVTSGGDGVFPRGLLVGFIGKNIERLGGFQNAEVKPALDLKKLDLVMVIQKKPTLKKDFPPLSPDSGEPKNVP